MRLHVTQGLDLKAGPGPHGRRWDFLTQELYREANILGASIELKIIIEQIREQVHDK